MATTRPAHGDPADELRRGRERLARARRARAARRLRPLRRGYIHYFTGFSFLSNERPIVFAQSAAGETVVFVPEFEVERTRAETASSGRVRTRSTPGREHPMRILAQLLASSACARRSPRTRTAYPGILGYRGPALSDVTGAAVSPIGDLIESMMARKSENEIAPHPRERALVRARAPSCWQEYTRRA
jgi:Xaa-Pro aminopeptidase